MHVLHVASDFWRRKGRVSEHTDLDADSLLVGVGCVVDGRSAHWAKVKLCPQLSTMGVIDGFRSLDGEPPRGCFAFDRYLLLRKPRLGRVGCARLPLTQLARTEGDPLWIWPHACGGELATGARRDPGFNRLISGLLFATREIGAGEGDSRGEKRSS